MSFSYIQIPLRQLTRLAVRPGGGQSLCPSLSRRPTTTSQGAVHHHGTRRYTRSVTVATFATPSVWSQESECITHTTARCWSVHAQQRLFSTSAGSAGSTCWNCGSKTGRLELFCPSCNTIQAPPSTKEKGDEFAILNSPVKFDVDIKAIETAYKTSQKVLHPDHFGRKSETEQKHAATMSAYFNDTVRVMRDPFLRAQLLLSYEGIDVGESGQAVTDPELLMEVMEVREQIAEASDPKELQPLRESLSARSRQLTTELAAEFSAEHWENAKSLTIQLRYLVKAIEEIDRITP
eukprot:GFYU01007604.1.p1 GENE.GFYU01007604.1~~GFYU01007604.1.p1  ORF type:complete len:293 (-),score=35.36 GFYU01007604.1:267-1145(-)